MTHHTSGRGMPGHTASGLDSPDLKPVSRRRGRLAGRLGIGTSLAVLVALLVPMAPAEASLAGVGPVGANGYPGYMEDASGLRLRLCDDPAAGCTMAAVPNPDAPVSFPANYAGENFYFAAATADASYEAALEAAFTTENATPGEQIMFSRIRIRLTGLVAGKTYHITHPYGVLDLVAEPDPKNPVLGEINYTDDQGCLAPPCGDFRTALGGFVGDSSATSMNFLTRVGFNAATAAEGAEIGDPLTPTAVTGSPFGTNAVTVEGPNAGGPGVDVSTQSSFTIEGQVFGSADPNRPSTPDLAAASDTGRADGDNITSDTTPTFDGTAAPGASVDLVVNGAVVGSTTATAGGSYSVTPAAPLAVGSPRIQTGAANPAYVATRDPANPAYIAASDPANPAYDPVAYPDATAYDVSTPARFTSGTLNMKIDTAAPATTIGTPKPTNGTIDPTPTFLFSSAEAGSDFECQLIRGGLDLTGFEPCTSPLTYDDQPDGSYTFNVRAIDAAGNIGNPAVHTWAIGTPVVAPGALVAPTVTGGNASATVGWRAPTTGGAVAGYTVHAFANNGATASVTVPNIAAGATSVTVPNLVNDTPYTFDVVATNAGGSATSPRSASVTPAVPAAPAPAAPTVSLASGTYTTAQSATMAPAAGSAAGTTVRYTVGTGTTVPADPTATTGTLYTGPLTVNSSQVVKARAFSSTGVASTTVVTRNYTVNIAAPAPAAPTVSLASGTYTTAQSATMAPAAGSAAGTTVRYTVGTGTTVPADPTATTGTLYTGPLTVNSSQVVKARAFSSTGVASTTVVTRNYTVNIAAPAPAAPTVSLASGTYTTAQSATMAPAAGSAAGTTVRYTVGTGTTVPADPTATTGTLYAGPVAVSTSRVVKAAAFSSTGVRSPVVTRTYTISAAAPATRPGAPTIGTATAGVAGGTVDANVTWTAPASTGGSPITGYRVRALRVTAAGGTALSTTVSATLPATTRSFRITTLPVSGANYQLEVVALNAIGTSNASARSNMVVGR